MARAVPPLNPLHVFETVARLGNLTKAAEELHVSQSAVSRQIAAIEGYLGVKLFRREPRGVSLTSAGASYYAEIGPAFGLIMAATKRLVTASRGGPLKVRAYATFSVKWLMRRLSRFHELHPDIDLRISTAVSPVNFEVDDVDIAIQFGKGNWAGALSERLFDDGIEPVCSPALLNSGPPLRTPDDLRHHRLLHSHYRRGDWPDWLKSVGRPELAALDGTDYQSSLLTYQAAQEGLGVAIGQTLLLAHELEHGLLARPFNSMLRRELGYYLLLPEGQPQTNQARAFCDWIKSEIPTPA